MTERLHFHFSLSCMGEEMATHSRRMATHLPGESQGRGAWWAAVYEVAQSQTRLKQLSSSSNFVISFKIRKYKTSNLVLFPDCFGYLESLDIPNEFMVEFSLS